MRSFQQNSGGPSSWIFGSRNMDLAWLFLPGVFVLLTNFFVRDMSAARAFVVYIFLINSFIGSGHIYITSWRTYLNPSERARHPVYFWAPIICFSLFFCWRYFAWSWLLYVPAYFTFWHHMRQSFGIQKWYQRQNGAFRRLSDYFVHFLCLWPFVILHFREPTEFKSIFLENDVLFYPSAALYHLTLAVYAIGVLAWLGYEATLLRHREWNRVGYIAISGMIYGLCLVLGRNEIEVMFPMVVYHGVAYFALTSTALSKTRPSFSLWRAAALLAVTALILGTYERVIEFHPSRVPLFWESVWAGVYVTPVLLHYIFDAVLWRKAHPESHLVFGSKSR